MYRIQFNNIGSNDRKNMSKTTTNNKNNKNHQYHFYRRFRFFFSMNRRSRRKRTIAKGGEAGEEDHITNMTAEFRRNHSFHDKRLFLYSFLFATSLSWCFGLISMTSAKDVQRRTVDSSRILARDGLPHCVRTTVVQGEVTHQDLLTTEVSVSTNVQLRLSLGETACFHVEVNNNNQMSGGSSSRELDERDSNRSGERLKATAENHHQNQNTNNKSEPSGQHSSSMKDEESDGKYRETLLYALEYSRLEDHHPIRNTYQFGIPLIRSDCVCDCPGGDNHCAVGYNYRKCNKGSACYTTYHANQSPRGCPTGESSELCCEISLTPYKNWDFWAFNIGHPDSSVAMLTLKLFNQQTDGSWTVHSANTLYIPLNSAQSFTLGRDKLRLKVHAPSDYNHLTPGQYFIRSNETRLRMGVPLNDAREKELGKLGWFRKINGTWQVESGNVKFQNAHHAQVTHCRDQTYSDSYDAEHYVSQSETERPGQTFEKFHLGEFIDAEEQWVQVAEVRSKEKSRFAAVTHRTSPPITLDLTMENRPRIKFYHHKSELRDFRGSIHLDKFSNRFLNITFLGARGTLLGQVYKTERRTEPDIAFSTFVNKQGQRTTHNAIITLPATVDTSRWVCFKASHGNKEELCKWLEYFSKPLPWFVVPHRWSQNQGDCPGCNEIGAQSFLDYLNPVQWFDGVSSLKEAVAMGMEIILYVIVLLVVIAVFRKCLCPFLNWSLKSPKKKRKSSPRKEGSTLSRSTDIVDI